MADADLQGATPPAPAPAPRRPGPGRGRGLVLLALGAAMLAAQPTVRWLTETSTDDASIEGRHTMLAPKVPGIVLEVLFDDNESVVRGQPLVRLDARDYEHALAAARAELQGVRAHLADASLKLHEAQALFQSGAINQQQRDTAESTAAALQAQAHGIEARIAQHEVDVAYATVRAPQAGVVGRRLAEPGMYAHAGQALISFVAGQERWVVANFKETQLQAAAPGAHATVTVDALGGRSFAAVVHSHSPSSGAIFALLPPDNATGNYIKVVQRVPVKLLLQGLTPEDVAKLPVGLNATVRIAGR
jgi:membrane fusion protein (multidrug efflux system)